MCYTNTIIQKKNLYNRCPSLPGWLVVETDVFLTLKRNDVASGVAMLSSTEAPRQSRAAVNCPPSLHPISKHRVLVESDIYLFKRSR